MEVKEQKLKILSPEGHELSVVKFESTHCIKQTVVISSATGVLQKYYRNFSSYLAQQGFVVYTFDYYGIGNSNGSVKALKKNTANLISWGKNDQASVIAFAKSENSYSKLTLITHSIGGQIFGFNPNHTQIDKAILIASQTGYWGTFTGLHKLKMWAFWNFLIPLATPFYGYFPAKKLGLFENLPKNVVYQWASWGTKKDYLMHFKNPEDYYFDTITIPILVLSFSKDNYAPRNAVDWLSSTYKKATITRIHHQPKLGEKHVGHFGFFKKDFKVPHWKQAAQWILTNKFE